ncbi:MAG: redox-sensing transcriptional repressor Rex [Bacteroidetes bacterium]|nr:MAG: redox-sensing transcriptional repressor Rex [Bacteroidota bacterium]
MKLLPERTVERLSKYRRVLQRELDNGTDHIYSHELAKLLHITPVQVRRDIMLIGHTGTLRKGYSIDNLIKLISEIIDCSSSVQNVAIVGIGKLGQALLDYLTGSNTKLNLSAVFDNNPDKIGTSYSGTVCYSIENLKKIVKREGITIGILTVPPEFAKEVSTMMKDAGIVGIINFTPVSLKLDGTFLEEYDVITTLEKVAYFSKPKNAKLL